ncbi:putative porin [Microbulbifer halophilus]|uniref:Porin n=1 Tax=Microbulbifer halophilus TaxID=453963 RepID=A0ABW5EC42_9GAMM|nr:putative porin [Microbulbifer halophilus]MCW8125446.1 putative porin [Microbulbifer halophilus]
MKFRFAALPLMMLAATASAESYNSITTGGYTNTESGNADADTFRFGSTYYFAPLETRGPLKEFDYIIRTTNLYGDYSYTDFDGGDADDLTLGGEYFAANGFMGGVEVNEGDLEDTTELTAGYLFNPDLLVSISRVDPDEGDAQNYVNARYNHRLGGTDYIGFNFETDDDFDSQSLSSKWFTKLGGQTWLAVDGGFTNHDEIDNDWNIGAEYYFSKATSVSAGYEDSGLMGDIYDLGVSHFFNRNVAGSLAYVTRDDVDVDEFQLGVTVQL